ncbi:hypothetical protein GQR58_029149 [Nymphon striatum]|nr:hypothetical protein GQR58_029149 [Nymphon striatum]
MLNPKRHEGQTTNLFDKRLNSKYESSMHNSAFTGVYIPPETVAHDQRTRNILPSWDMEAFHRSSAINPDYHSLRENVIRYDGRVCSPSTLPAVLLLHYILTSTVFTVSSSSSNFFIS